MVMMQLRVSKLVAWVEKYAEQKYTPLLIGSLESGESLPVDARGNNMMEMPPMLGRGRNMEMKLIINSETGKLQRRK